MKVEKSLKREKKQFKKRHGMRVSNKSIFTLDRVSKGLFKRKSRGAPHRQDKNSP